MSLIDLVIIAVVAVATVLCIRSFRRNDDCADCASAGICSAADRAAGHCVQADDMLARVDAAFAANDLTDSSGKKIDLTK